MPKISQCDRCQFYSHNPHLVCAVHPDGVEEKHCLDFRQKLGSSSNEELWCPQGYSWYGDELIPDCPPRLTTEEQLYLLDYHPLFTGCCPQCRYVFSEPNPSKVHWDCPECGWVDDTV